ncbi:MAG: chemotaxis protein CheW [Burkholderiaceae bacterium]
MADAVRRFGVRVGARRLMLPAGEVSEFVSSAEIFPLPGAPAAVAGLIELHGYPVPVFALGEQAAVAPRIRRHAAVAIGVGSDAVALLVDAAPVELFLADGHPRSPGPDGTFESADSNRVRAHPAGGPDEPWQVIGLPAFFHSMLEGRGS